MHYNFIEIGTSDFNTLIENQNCGVGLSIEPLKIYLDRLPNRDSVTKVNCAISDKDDLVDIFWIDPEDIKKYNLPDWLRGCNSIVNEHPTAIAELRGRGIEHIYKKDKCEVICWNTLIQRYNIESVDYLKIDTEGHDCIIIKGILDSELKVLPKKIFFENNILTNNDLTEKILKDLEKSGYKIITRTPDDILVQLIN